MSLEMITDRTNEDVTAKNAKGTYNAQTLNRVENAVAYIAQRLSANGYPTTVTVKGDWREDKPENFATAQERINNFPTAEQMARYLGNVRHCLRQYCKRTDTPELPESIDGLDYLGANAIERVLEDIDELLDNMLAQQRYAGTFYAGEDCP